MTFRIGATVAAAVLVMSLTALGQSPNFAITSPKDNATVPGSPIVIRGEGAEPGTTLEVRVLTNAWYPQDGKGAINRDGSWTYGPVHLGGQGQYNNHTIEVTMIKNNQRGDTVTVSGIVRK